MKKILAFFLSLVLAIGVLAGSVNPPKGFAVAGLKDCAGVAAGGAVGR